MTPISAKEYMKEKREQKLICLLSTPSMIKKPEQLSKIQTKQAKEHGISDENISSLGKDWGQP